MKIKVHYFEVSKEKQSMITIIYVQENKWYVHKNYDLLKLIYGKTHITYK